MDAFARDIAYRAHTLLMAAERMGDGPLGDLALLIGDLCLLYERGRDPPRRRGRLRFRSSSPRRLVRIRT